MIAHHIIFGVYGFWLPNDPRGSWSDFVGSWDLFRYGGKATKSAIPGEWDFELIFLLGFVPPCSS